MRQVFRLGTPQQWDSANFPYFSHKTFPEFEEDVSYIQMFVTHADEARWYRLTKRIFAILRTSKRLRSQVARVELYRAILLGDYIPKFLQRYGYSRFPPSIAERIQELEGWNHNQHIFHFWAPANVPLAQPTNDDHMDEEDEQNLSIRVSDSSENPSDDSGEDTDNDN